MMMPNYPCDLCVVLYIRQNPLADNGMLLHPTALIQCQGAGLLQQTSWKTHFADVVHKPAQMHELLLLWRQPHALGNIARIDGNCR